MQDLLLSKASLTRLEALATQPKQTILLSGAPGVGKKTAANWLALQAVGRNWRRQLIEIDPNDRGNISINSIHEIRNFTQYKSANSQDRRVVIINDAHSMSIEAQNAFLKLLEEPSDDVLVILLAWQPQKLLETIRSRVTILELSGPKLEQLFEYYPDTDKETVRKAFHMAGGAPELINDIISGEGGEYQDNISQAKNILGMDAYQRLLLVDALSKDKPQAESLLAAVSQVLFAAMKVGVGDSKRTRKMLPKIEATESARQALRKNHNTKLTLSLLFTNL